MKRVVAIIAILFSAIFLVLGVVSVLQQPSAVLRYLNVPTEGAVHWFVLSFVAAIIPFTKEVTLFGYGFKLLDEIRKANKRIDSLESVINSQKTASREYLINSFNEHVSSLPSETMLEKVFGLNKIYFEELGVSVVDVKKALNRWFQNRKGDGAVLLKNESERIDEELIAALKLFQRESCLKNSDGIFGYYTCEKLKKYMDIL
ncbi:MAG: hypothetical protein JW783_10175 [Bacteroidales bacterium]|nr:hypothetical protein [Bacteroidales bacterium]MBN2748920.1 hypothetical protein [Bacteroidales bacterium]